MLQNLRNTGKTWVGKVLAAVLFTLLILSFAVWGIGDIFRGGASQTVAQVGETRIDAGQARDAYTRELRQLSAQFGTVITPEQARMFGLDRQVLGRLVTEAVLDERARQLGLRVGETLVARSIVEDPSFQANGSFDRNAFQRYLSFVGLSEQGFVAQQRAQLARSQVVDAVIAEIDAPIAAQEAVHRYGAERRTARYLLLPETLAGEVAPPEEAALEAFFAERRSQWRAPEYRAFEMIALTPEAIADPAAIADAAARQRYQQVAETRFGSPERRRVQRIPFANAADAAAAQARLASQETSFEALAVERGVTDDVLDLGLLSRGEIVDPAIAEAAFALDIGPVAGPVEGRFGSALVRVTEIQPAVVRPFEEVEAEIRAEIAREEAQARIRTLYDAIEDQRAGARPLTEIASEFGVPFARIEGVDRQGRGLGGQPLDLPGGNDLLNAVFESDIGVDDRAVRTEEGGYVWFALTDIAPARERSLDEVREEVVAAWRADQVAQRLDEIARGFVQRIEAGESLEAIGAETGLQVAAAQGLARGQAAAPLPETAVARVFAAPIGSAATAPVDATRRVVFVVDGASAPPFLTTTPQAEMIGARVAAELAQDIIEQYLAALQAEMGVRIDEEAFRAAVGGAF